MAMNNLLKTGTRNADGIAIPLISDRDGILSVTDSGRYIPRRNDKTSENLVLARRQLKAKYIDTQTAILASEEDIASWDAGISATGSFSWDGTKNAAKFVSFTTSNKQHKRDYATPLDMSADTHVCINIETDLNDFSSIIVRFFTDSNNYYTWNLSGDCKSIFGNGEMTFGKDSFDVYGTPTWSSISSVAFRVTAISASGENTVYIKDFYAVKSKPKNAKILFRLDDGLLSVYEGAMPVFRKYNIPASCFVNPGYVDPVEHLPHTSYGGNPAMNLKEITELHSMGWSICSHTWYHNLYQDPTINSQSAAALLRNKYSQAYHDLSAVQDWLYDHGFSDGAQCSVYGNHYYNEETLQAETDLMLLGFSMHSNQSQFDTLPWGKGIRHLPSYYFFMHETVDGEEVFPYVDQVVNRGGLTVVMCHRFDADAPDDILPDRPESVSSQGSIKPETLEACLEYLCSKNGVDCITAADLTYATPAALR